jgi:sulfur carrier protein
MIISVNGAQREVADRARLADVLDRPTGDIPRGIAVAVDGNVVPRARLGEVQLTEGARVEIVRAVQGG